jgi:hypothetical protein
MEYLIGVGLAVVVCAFTTLVGFDRDRVFYWTLVTRRVNPRREVRRYRLDAAYEMADLSQVIDESGFPCRCKRTRIWGKRVTERIMKLNWKRASWGALIGVVLGMFLAEHRVRQVPPNKGR